MIEKIRSELLPLAEKFQTAGADGLRRVVEDASYDGAQWKIKRLQRDPFLHGLRHTLPENLGTFVLDADLYRQNRLVYRSQVHEAELIFRRRGSLDAYKSKREDAASTLFPTPERIFPPRPDAQFRQIACIWDLPVLNEDYEAIGPFPFRVQIAKQNTLLDQGQWESSFSLLPEPGIMPTSAEFDMDSPDWDVDGEEETEGQ